MIVKDGKKIIPFYEDYKPVEVRRNNVRIAGWLTETKSGEAVDFENTYNDKAEVLVSGESEQVQTVQGKNLFDDNKILDFSNYETISSYDYLKLDVKPLTFYTIKLRDDFNLEVLPLPSAGNYAFRINNAKEMDATKTVINIRSSGIRESRTITLQSNSEGELYIVLYRFTQPLLDLIRNAMQLEEGSTATPYEPFVPDSPSPDYPSPVNSAGDCNLVISNQTEVKQLVELPVLRKIGDVADTYNPATGEYVQRIGVKVFDGTEGVFLTGGDADEFCRYYYYFSLIKPSGNPDGLNNLLCSHFKEITHRNVVNKAMEGIGVHNSSAQINFVVKEFRSVDTFKAFLAAQYAAGTPVTVYYQLATPVVTYLDPATVPTFYPYTRIEQDGAVKGVIEATCKVIED